MSYTTWMDFSRRMLGSEVSEEDWRQFVTLYQGFIIGYCKKKFVNHKDPAGSLSEDKISIHSRIAVPAVITSSTITISSPSCGL